MIPAVVPGLISRQTSPPITNFLSLTDAVNINEKKKKNLRHCLKSIYNPPPLLLPLNQLQKWIFPRLLEDISFGLLSESVLNPPLLHFLIVELTISSYSPAPVAAAPHTLLLRGARYLRDRRNRWGSELHICWITSFAAYLLSRMTPNLDA